MVEPKLLGKKTTWGVITLSVVFAVLCFCLAAKISLQRFSVMGDIHVIKCMPYTLMVIDTWDHTPTSGYTYAFKAKNTVIFPDGSILGKKLIGNFKDEIEIDADENIKLNADTVGHGLQKAASLRHERKDFMGKGYLDKDEFFALGTNQSESIDSRYWGNVNENQVIGRLYPIF